MASYICSSAFCWHQANVGGTQSIPHSKYLADVFIFVLINVVVPFLDFHLQNISVIRQIATWKKGVHKTHGRTPNTLVTVTVTSTISVTVAV
jgi:hypothetical protein